MDDDLSFDSELQGGIKWQYENFHILSMIYQQKLLVQKGSRSERECMLDYQWDSIPNKNKEQFMAEWAEIETMEAPKNSNEEVKTRKNYDRMRRKAQLISNVLLTIKVINYAPPSQVEEIIRLGMEVCKDEEE